MAHEHTFCGTWEIVESSLHGKSGKTGLEGIKFRLDEMGDIIWYNDLINPIQNAERKKSTGDYEQSYTIDDSANALFSCETFEIIEITSNGPGLVFGAYAGLSIEFKTNSFTPSDTMTLICDEWCYLVCQRVKENQSAGQEMPFSLLTALYEGYFSDVLIKSTDNVTYHVHSPILRLNGFDCTISYQHTPIPQQYQFQNQEPHHHHHHHLLQHPHQVQSTTTTTTTTTTATATTLSILNENISSSSNDIKSMDFENQIKISISSHKHINKSQNDLPNISPNPSSSSNFLLPPSLDMFNFSPRLVSNISNSFNCLTTAKESDIIDFPKRYPTSSSDSNLQTSKDVFNFSPSIFLAPIDTKIKNKPLSSPYRVRSPSPFPSFLDTPPSSPLTPISVLYNLPSFMLSPILHWLYAECLPHSLEEETCEKLISIGESTPPLNKLVEPCRKYLKNIKIKKFVIDVMMDMHSCLNRMIQSINPSIISHNSTVLCQIFKQGIREAAIDCVKLLQFCNIFVKDAANLSRYQRHEIIKYVRTRLPIFMSQFHQILQNIFGVLSSLTIDEKTELVIYLVPEIETSLEIITDLIIEIKASLEKVCKDLNPINNVENCSRNKDKTPTKHSRSGGGGVVGSGGNRQPSDENITYNTTLFQSTPIVSVGYEATSPKRFTSSENDLKFVLYMYEVKKMRDIYGRITSALEIIQHKKITFRDMTTIDKQRTVHRNLEQLILEMPSYIKRLEEISDSMDEKIGWKEFKFCFKLATSQINGVISKLLDHKSALNDAIEHICGLVQRDQFTQAMIDLGLLEENNILQNEIRNFNKNSNNTFDYNTAKLNLIRNLCESPTAAQSSLSKNALRLLHSGQLADMEFEINYMPNSTQNNPTNKTNNDLEDDDELFNKIQVHTFKAHRVIIAARCEWFRKALLSGMQEDINRKITIHDVSPVIFRRLLLYLYGAPIDRTVGVEQICELMLLADRYSVDELKDICETTLISLIDEESVVCLLGIADRFNASSLKANSLSFLSQNSHLAKSDIFYELPKILQLEVQDLIQWCGRVPEPWNDRDRTTRNSLKSPSRTSKSRSRRSSPSFM